MLAESTAARAAGATDKLNAELVAASATVDNATANLEALLAKVF
jgi:hypothetical protein